MARNGNNYSGMFPMLSGIFDEFEEAENLSSIDVRLVYERNISEHKDDLRYFAALVDVLNWKRFEYGEPRTRYYTTYANLYSRAYKYADSIMPHDKAKELFQIDG